MVSPLRLFLLGSIFAITSAFQASLPSPPPSTRASTSLCIKLKMQSNNYMAASCIDIAENAERDVSSLYTWAADYGVQTADCFELSSEVLFAGQDIFAITNQNLPANTPVVCVPKDLILSGNKARQELSAPEAERALKLSDHTSFYLFLKILKEYELGDQSPWYSWLNSLPRFYSTAASLSAFCFSCLPPYASKQGQAEKSRLKRFEAALDEIQFLSEQTKSNADLLKWAYNVVRTRYHENDGGDYCIAPMADYFNHGGTETEVYISFDQEGNCYASTTRDVPAGQPLRISYGDPTNPSQLLATYGFLDESSPGTYCKWIADEASSELFNLGYPNKMLFYNDGNISNEVWDVLLYQELGKISPEQQSAFYQAHMTGDEATKSSYHQQYFPQTLAVLQQHVSNILGILNELDFGKNVPGGRHPRLPLLLRHNDFVKQTFQLVQANLNSMSS